MTNTATPPPTEPPVEKPKRNWRGFLKEYAVIVIGVLTALAAQQAAEALRHRSDAREMTQKLLEESSENLKVMDYSIPQAEAAITALEGVMKAVSADAGAAQPLQLPFVTGVIGPGDSAWLAVQYSALLPIMPEALIANYWKIQRTNEVIRERGLILTAEYRKAMAAVEVYNRSSEKASFRQTLLLRLADTKQFANAYLRTARSFKEQNRRALAGKEITLDLVRSLPGEK